MPTHRHRDTLSARFFPNVNVGGFYSPHTLSIGLNVLPPANGEKGAPEREAWFREHLPLIAHEYQHGLDHVGTIVGRKLLDGLRDAYQAFELKRKFDISGLPHWVTFHDLQKRFYRRSYFTENDSSYRAMAGTHPQWRWEMTIGRGFDFDGNPDCSDPILFVSFYDVVQDKKVARQPLTAAALFEARAVSVELENLLPMKAVELAEMPAEWAAFEADQQAMFYDVDLTMYSAPVHLLAARLNIADPILAYRLASILSWVALNIPDGLPLAAKLPGAGSLGPAQPLVDRLLGVRDPGYLFYCLAVWAPPFLGDEEAWLAECLGAAGFPSRQEIETAVYEALKIPKSGGAPSRFDVIYWSAVSAGAINFKRLAPEFGLFGSKTLLAIGTTTGPVSLPNTIVGPAVLSPIAVQPYMSLAQQELVGEMEKDMEQQMREFLGACR